MLAGVVLAAGSGTRFTDGNKLVFDVDGKPMVRRAVNTVLTGELNPVVVVTGFDAAAVRDALAGLDVEFAHNPDASSGQSSSVAVGVNAVRDRDVDGVVVMLGDMPFVEPETVSALVDAFESPVDVVVPTHAGRRGNPVVFGADWFERLASLSGDVGGRALFDAASLTRVSVDDPGVQRDVDTRSDLDT